MAVTPRFLGVLVALPVVAALVVGLVLMSSDDEPVGSLPPELSSAIRRSLASDRIRMESPGVTEDFVAPDRLATEYSVDGTFREIIVGRTAYVTDVVDGSGYVSCPLPSRPRSTARSASRALLFLEALARAKPLEEHDGADAARYRVRITLGTDRDGQPSAQHVEVRLDDGFVRTLGAPGESFAASFTYGRASVEVPSADEVRAVSDCNEGIQGAPMEGGRPQT